MRQALPVVAAAAILAAGGCGGGGETPTADVSELASCLEQSFSEVSTGEGLDFIAKTAGIGGVQVVTEGNEIQVVAERSESDAEKTQGEYLGFTNFTATERLGTVVLAYKHTPVSDESEPIKDCLSDQGIE